MQNTINQTASPFSETNVLQRAMKFRMKTDANTTVHVFDLKCAQHKLAPSLTGVFLSFEDSPLIVTGTVAMTNHGPQIQGNDMFTDTVLALALLLPEGDDILKAPLKSRGDETGAQEAYRKQHVTSLQAVCGTQWKTFVEDQDIFLEQPLDIQLSGFISSGAFFAQECKANNLLKVLSITNERLNPQSPRTLRIARFVELMMPNIGTTQYQSGRPLPV
jgi:hypothetical protein